MEDTKHFSLRIDSDLLKKFRYVCSYEDRSANGQLLYFIKQFVKEFEEEHGKISLDNEV